MFLKKYYSKFISIIIVYNYKNIIYHSINFIILSILLIIKLFLIKLIQLKIYYIIHN